MGFVLEVLFQIVFEAIFEGIWYALKRFWYWITGQGTKKQRVLTSHLAAKEDRRERVEQIRRRRDEKKQ